jgi:hypothetical protein
MTFSLVTELIEQSAMAGCMWQVMIGRVERQIVWQQGAASKWKGKWKMML